MRLFKSIFFCFTIWVTTALLNGFMSGSFLMMTTKEFAQWPDAFFTLLFCTLFFPHRACLFSGW
ncbi:MAG: hypothetical protein JWP81_5313 [Ferruginibacter sp.]|nr:hypothetical protein [Ferruginibacter sp.]